MPPPRGQGKVSPSRGIQNWPLWGQIFIGSAVIRHIINNTVDSVINVDKLTYAGNLDSLVEVADNDRYAFEQVDICDKAKLERIFTKYQPDAVMHLAAESHVDRSIDGPSAFIETNIVGTYTIQGLAPQVPVTLSRHVKKSLEII